MAEIEWRVPRALPVLKGAGAVAAALTALLFGDDLALFFVGWVAVIAGFAARRRLPWEQIDVVRVDERPHLGLRTETLEIDTGDRLYLISRYDLGVPPAEVVEALDALRASRS